MDVTIIGAGNMGRGIGHRIVAGGHDLTIVDRDPEEAERLAEELRGAAEAGTTVEAEGPGAELRGEVVILAVYYPGDLEIARDLGEGLAGKVVVDISNPLNETFDALATAPGTSAAEEVAAAAPSGAGSEPSANPLGREKEGTDTHSYDRRHAGRLSPPSLVA